MTKGYSGKSGLSSSGMRGLGKGYSGKGGFPRSGMYGLENCLGGMKGYMPNQKGSGMTYIVIGIGYAGNPGEMAQCLQQYMAVLGQYLTKLSGNQERSFQRYKDLTPDEGFYKSFNRRKNEEQSNCEICGAPTFKGIDRCSTCSSAMGGY